MSKMEFKLAKIILSHKKYKHFKSDTYNLLGSCFLDLRG